MQLYVEVLKISQNRSSCIYNGRPAYTCSDRWETCYRRTYPMQTVGKYDTDVHTPIQTVIQTVVKIGTDVQTMRKVKVIKFETFNHQQSVRLYYFSQGSV